LDLTTGGGDWTGSAVIAAPLTESDSIDYVVQVVDDAGNVAASSNKAVFYKATPAPTNPGSVQVSVVEPLPPSGWYTRPVTLHVSYPLQPIRVGIDDGADRVFDPGNPLHVSGSLQHVVTAVATTGATGQVNVPIDSDPPAISIADPGPGVV